MTIGSATYTVNGTEKTADVAPFINGSRTMVPVRFAAEAFGIKVIPTYNPDGIYDYFMGTDGHNYYITSRTSAYSKDLSTSVVFNYASIGGQFSVSQRYNLIATASIKVTADAAELAFSTKTAEVNVNNKIDVQIVDADGNKVAPTNIAKTLTSFSTG